MKLLPPFILIILILTACLDWNAPGLSAQEKKELGSYEKEMAERPQEAMSIARRAATVLTGDEKQLFSWAAKRQEKILAELSLAQAIELAEVFEKKLEDAQAGRHVRITWLTSHVTGLTPDDVRRLLGLPQKQTFQIVYRRQLEQWVYEQPSAVWLTFSCTKGHVHRLQAVQTSHREKP